MVLFYDVVLTILFIPALIILALRYRRRLSKEFFYGWKEKLGIWDAPGENVPSTPLIWIHCASIGEVRAIEPMLKGLDGYRVLLTVLTYSGIEYARKQKLADLVYFAPVDFSFVVNRLFKRFHPRAIIIVETELWPGLLFAARKNGVKALIVNARMSERSFGYYSAANFFWKSVLDNVDRLCARSDEDAEKFVKIGFPAARMTVTGNIKYDRDFNATNFTRRDAGLADSDFVIVCGSTRKGEEEIILDAWKELAKKHPNVKLVIAPRHLNRIPEIVKLMDDEKINYRLRSSAENKQYGCLLVDTFGELQKFYSLADVSFAGGSLVNKGGQNPIEPAAYSKPVLFGPYMSNFLAEANILIKGSGGFMVKDKNELLKKAELFYLDDDFRIESGRKALAAVESQKGALKRTLDEVKGLLA